jgi:tetratricopeptide (TPR) repeat protein
MRIVAAMLLLLIDVQLASAAATDGRERARALYDSGTAHYNLGEYDAALSNFREAYRLHQDPALLFNLAQCHRQLRHYSDAAAMYRAYRREATESQRADIDKLIDEMDRAAREHPPAPARGESPPMPAVSPGVVAVTTAAPMSDRPSHRKSRAWIWGVAAGGAVVVAGAIAIGIVYGSPVRYPTASAGSIAGN